MVLKILLLLSIVLQLIAVLTAIRLTKITRFNFSWILFTIALTTMAFMRCGEYLQLIGDKNMKLPTDFFVWLGAVTSVCFAVGIFFVKKIFNNITVSNHIKAITEKRILSAILSTEERERWRFSKELHDGLGPLLSSTKMSLSALKKDELSTHNHEILNNTLYVLDEAIRSLREVSNNLSPHTLTDFGLARAIQNFINRSTKGNDIDINLSTNLKTERFDTEIEVILYRVICELLNNSLKHSQCSKIALKIIYENSIISINYKDNGKGFNPKAVMDIGMGLSNINSRISSLKGQCNTVSSPGDGVRTIITVDISNNDRDKI